MRTRHDAPCRYPGPEGDRIVRTSRPAARGVAAALVTLQDDGTYTATDVPIGAPFHEPEEDGLDPDTLLAMSGTWELHESTGDDWVRLSLDELTGADLDHADVQMFLHAGGGLRFSPNPDRPPTLVLRRDG